MSRTSNKSHHRKGRKFLGVPTRALPWIAAALIFLPIVGLLLFAQPAGGTDIDPNFTPKVSGAPSLEVAQASFELGDQHFNVPVQVVYNLKNVGDQALRITDVPQVKVLEGC